MKKTVFALIFSLGILILLSGCDTFFSPNLDGVSFDSAEFTYDGEEKSILISGELPSGVTVQYEGNTATDAGEYTASAKFYKNGEYIEGSELTASLVIKKAVYDTSSFGFESKTVLYDGNPHSIELDESKLPNGITVTYRGNGAIDVGEHRIVAVFKTSDKNYESIEPITAVLKIELDGYDSDGLIYEELVSGELEVVGYRGSSACVYIPNTYDGKKISAIESEAFLGMDFITKVYISDNVNRIGNKAFADTSLTEIRLSKNLEVIGDVAFTNTSITDLSLPDTLISAGFGMLKGVQLESISVPFIGGSHQTTNFYFGYIFGSPSYTVSAEYVPASLKTVTVTSACEKIPAYAFMGCANIESVIIESGVSYIGNAAFSGCTSMNSIYIPSSVVKIPADAHYYDSPFFGACESLTVVLGSGENSGYGKYFANTDRNETAKILYSKTLDEYFSLFG